MSKRVQIRGGSTAAHALFTGAQREVTVDTDLKTLVVHDGSTAGGFSLARADTALASDENLADVDDAEEARENISVFSKVDVYSLAGLREPSTRLFFDGITTDQRFSIPLNYNLGTTEFTIRAVFRMPSSNSARRTVLYCSSGNSAPAANSLALILTASGDLEVRLYGASTSDYTYSVTTGLSTTFAGKIVEVHLVRSYSGVTLYVNGEAQSWSAAASFGTGPGFTASITSTYLVVGSGVSSTSPFQGDFLALTLLDYPLSAAQSATVFVEGVLFSDEFGNTVPSEAITLTVNRDFSGASNWANSTFTSYDESGDLSVTASASGQLCALPAAQIALPTPAAAKRYYISCDVANLSGGPFTVRGSNEGLVGTISANGKFSCNFVVAQSTFGDLQIQSLGSGSVDLDNFTFHPVGAVVDLSFGEASWYFIPDRSPNYLDAIALGTNRPAIFGAARRSAWVRGSTNTNGNQQLLLSEAILSYHRISGIFIYNVNDGTAVTSVNIGTSSGAADIASAVAISTGRNEVGTFLSRYSGTGNIWINANGTSRLLIRVFFDEVD